MHHVDKTATTLHRTDTNSDALTRETTKYSTCQCWGGKTLHNTRTYLTSCSHEKWQHKITRGDAKLLNVNSALETGATLPVVDRLQGRARVTTMETTKPPKKLINK